MKIVIINGSPKRRNSNSELLISYMTDMLGEDNDIRVFILASKRQYADALENLDCDALLFVFPLYDDSIPSRLLEFLADAEGRGNGPMVYCCINNGFFEGRQNRIAIAQMKLWCKKSGAKWGQAIGLGAGEMLPFWRVLPLWLTPYASLWFAFRGLASKIQGSGSGEDRFLSPLFPRFLWKNLASLFFWHPKALRNGVAGKELYRQL